MKFNYTHEVWGSWGAEYGIVWFCKQAPHYVVSHPRRLYTVTVSLFSALPYPLSKQHYAVI